MCLDDFGRNLLHASKGENKKVSQMLIQCQIKLASGRKTEIFEEEDWPQCG